MSCDSDQDYERLCKALKTISSLEGISGIIGWDEMVRLKSPMSCVPFQMDVDMLRQHTLMVLIADAFSQVMMPSGAASSRAAQKEALAGVIYEKVPVLQRQPSQKTVFHPAPALPQPTLSLMIHSARTRRLESAWRRCRKTPTAWTTSVQLW